MILDYRYSVLPWHTELQDYGRLYHIPTRLDKDKAAPYPMHNRILIMHLDLGLNPRTSPSSSS